MMYCTALYCTSEGTPSISDMALIALRNHGMLSHWTADSVLHCMSVVGGHAEGESPSDPILSSLSSSSVPSSNMKCSLHDGACSTSYIATHVVKKQDSHKNSEWKLSNLDFDY